MIELEVLTNRQIVILSGKGGTGKTTISAAFAHLSSLSEKTRAVLVDADVDAANLELLLKGRQVHEKAYSGGKIAKINSEICISCGSCAEVCRFDAVNFDGKYEINPLDCEGCAACWTQCPVSAIEMIPTVDGQSYVSESAFGLLYHASLFPAAENSGKLVSYIRKEASEAARMGGNPLTIIDGPPGIGCPVIAACTGTDLAVIVTEPTASGIADLKRIMATTRHFNLPTIVILNKADVYPEGAQELEAFCAQEGVELIARIPFDTTVTEAMVKGITITQFASESAVGLALRAAWQRILQVLAIQ